MIMPEISLFFLIRATINYNDHVPPHFDAEYNGNKVLADIINFTQLQDLNLFKNCCTVLNGTLAWDLEGNYDETKCLDLDPFNIYENSLDVEESEFLFSRKSQKS